MKKDARITKVTNVIFVLVAGVYLAVYGGDRITHYIAMSAYHAHCDTNHCRLATQRQ